MKPLLSAASLLLLLSACHMYDGTHTATVPTNGSPSAASNCRDWNYKPGTQAYANCINQMSAVKR